MDGQTHREEKGKKEESGRERVKGRERKAEGVQNLVCGVKISNREGK